MVKDIINLVHLVNLIDEKGKLPQLVDLVFFF